MDTVTAYYSENQYGLHPMDYANVETGFSALQAIRNAIEWGAGFVEIHTTNGAIYGIRIQDNNHATVVYSRPAEPVSEPVTVAIAEPVQVDPYADDMDDLTHSGSYCVHGTFVGNAYGPDYLCGYCETDTEPVRATSHVANILAAFIEHTTGVSEANALQRATDYVRNYA